MNKRYFIITTLFIFGTFSFYAKNLKENERDFWVNSLIKIADPVLENLSQNKLKEKMPIENETGNRYKVTHLEAFGRVMCGISPWLELGPDNTLEGKLRKKYIDLSIKCLHNIVDPQSPDCLNFITDKQPLVDAAFLAEALLRSPKELWGNLDEITRRRLIEAFKSTRSIQPGNNNWLLFSAMIETALLRFSGEYDSKIIDFAFEKFKTWYKGDGWYGDGENFHTDYYNSIVIHPMMMDVLMELKTKNLCDTTFYKKEKNRWKRFAAIQERFISPEGTYPVIGRSLAYRFGVFHCLAQVALMHELPSEVKPSQVRCALTKVIRNQLNAPGTFDKNGWLQIGIYGHQPEIAEKYISTGSLYMCTVAFLPLGLPASDEFWNSPAAEWTNIKVWSGKNIKIDHAIQN